MTERGTARLFGLPPGIDQAQALVDGLLDRLPDDPVALARVTLFVNTSRAKRQLQSVFEAGPARLLPKLRLISDLAEDAGFPDIPPTTSRLELSLDVAELLFSLIERQPELAPRSAVFDLADSLVALIEEMDGEGVSADTLGTLDVGAHARHWQHSRAVVEATIAFLSQKEQVFISPEARQRRIVEALVKRWEIETPKEPVVIAGSTGSRGATRLLMQAVARLPEGYVVLPGVDFEQPARVWQELDRGLAAQDHPQYRFRALASALGLEPAQLQNWCPKAVPRVPSRNRLVSLALRPAPVTDQWRDEGRRLEGIDLATQEMTLLNAPNRREEAAAIAVSLRNAVAEGKTAALISPDRMLTRRVAAALVRWGIEPDDSAGEPLHQTAVGRFLRHTATLLSSPPELPMLLALLKHPICASSEGLRGPHLLRTQQLELSLRRDRVAQPTGDHLRAWAEKQNSDEGRQGWAEWLGGLLDGIVRGRTRSLANHLTDHLALTEALAAGPGAEGSGKLWDQRAGSEAADAVSELRSVGERGGGLSDRDYGTLLNKHLSTRAVVDPNRPHPDVMIWGTLEARGQTADLAILGGLNEGIWPATPGPDTWLNRDMRADLGLLLPDRRIGLAAHDFQMAIAAPAVILSRSARDEDAETVPSRWLNRLTNMLRGLGPNGSTALEQMEQRGNRLLALSADLDMPGERADPAPRPSPRPPVSVRPKELPVTGVSTLIRDPYAVYAGRVLRLAKLAPLTAQPDAALKGIALHAIMEDFIGRRADWVGDHNAARACLSEIADIRFSLATPSPSIRALWHARLMGIADRLIGGEDDRAAGGRPALTERTGGIPLEDIDFRLTARPDRIDRLVDGSFAIFDYKSGRAPSDAEIRHFEKQLPLEAAILEEGGFDGLGRGLVSKLGFISLGSSDDRPVALDDEDGHIPSATLQKLHRLISRYNAREQGYTAIRAAHTTRFSGDYDHLARYGEWDLTNDAMAFDVGPAEDEG